MTRCFVLLAGLLSLLVLVGAFLVVSSRGQVSSKPPSVPGPLRLEAWAGPLLLLLGCWPILRLAPWIDGSPACFWGDVASHIRVAAELERGGWRHFWSDSYVGGFPLGHHYPMLGWLLLAAELALGLSAHSAGHLLGWCATLAAPIVLYWAMTRSGIRPRFSLIAGVYLAWVSPYNAFIGGLETYFGAGLLSQVLALPLCIWFVSAHLSAKRRWEVVSAAALCMMAHPQLATCTGVVLVVATLATAKKSLLREGARSVGCLGLIGAALYGQGILTLEVPFGWPENLGWRQLGFRPDRLNWWFVEGDLLDLDRPAVLTALLSSAVLVACLLVRRAAARAVLAALVVAVLTSVSGFAMRELGGVGQALLAFFQPLRMIALVPPLAAATVAWAAHEATRLLVSASEHRSWSRADRHVGAAVVGLCLLIALFGLPSRLERSGRFAAQLGDGCSSPGDRRICRDEREVLSTSLRALDGGGLLVDDTKLLSCLGSDGMDLEPPVAIWPANGVGAHVAMLNDAARQVQPWRPGSTRRAEALGLKYVLLEGDGSQLNDWTPEARTRELSLWSHPTGRVAVGCIVERWYGSPGALSTLLRERLATAQGADLILDPHRFTQLEFAEETTGEVRRTQVKDDCSLDAGQVLGVTQVPGRIEVELSMQHAADVIIRATAFPGWHYTLDGEVTLEPRLIAPGFASVPVPAGTHRLIAQSSALPGYGMWLLLALIVVFGANRGQRHSGSSV